MWNLRTSIAALLLPAAGGFLLALSGTFAPGDARASVPAGPPAFGDPTDFSNPFFPFTPGGTRIFTGKSDGAAIVLLDSFLAETRDFSWNGGTVACRVLVETEFEDGALVEITRNFFAEADDGSVWYFGETVDNYEDGAIADHEGSWIVGTPIPGDPAGIFSVTGPALFMPATPEAGDEFMPEDVPGGPQEIDTVTRVDRRVRVAAGTFEGCVEVHEENPVDGDTETKWYAPGIGVVRGKQKGEAFALVATSYAAVEAE